jgi:pimeloyl-ACP methyl ester carboxylesterase
MADFSTLWEAVEAVDGPLVLLRGANSGVVGDEDVEELLRRKPDAQVIVVPDAGHSIQGDQPLVLAQHLEEILAGPKRA